jgi:transposase
MLAELDAGSVVLRAVKRTLVRGLVYGEDAIDVISVRRWVRRFKSSQKDIGERPRSGRPDTAKNMEAEENVDVLMWGDSDITTSELRAAIGIGKRAVVAIIRELGYRNVCAR